jgi:hypothetical protein
MGATIEEILDSFRELPESEKYQIASEILRWSREADHPSLEDEELALAADDVFRAYEEDEERS